MSEENVDLVRGLLERFIATGELSWDLMHEDIVVHDHDTVLDTGDYRGHAGLRAMIENWESAWSDYSMEPDELLDAGERVVVVFKMTAKGRASGVELERQDAMLFAVRHGKVSRLDYFNNRAQAVEAAGLAA